MKDDYEKRTKRMQQKDRHIARQVKLKSNGNIPNDIDLKQPHRLAKRSAWTCGNKNCAMCGNPRKFFGELTIQEQKQLEYMKSFDTLNKENDDDQ